MHSNRCWPCHPAPSAEWTSAARQGSTAAGSAGSRIAGATRDLISQIDQRRRIVSTPTGRQSPLFIAVGPDREAAKPWRYELQIGLSFLLLLAER